MEELNLRPTLPRNERCVH